MEHKLSETKLELKLSRNLVNYLLNFLTIEEILDFLRLSKKIKEVITTICKKFLLFKQLKNEIVEIIKLKEEEYQNSIEENKNDLFSDIEFENNWMDDQFRNKGEFLKNLEQFCSEDISHRDIELIWTTFYLRFHKNLTSFLLKGKKSTNFRNIDFVSNIFKHSKIKDFYLCDIGIGDSPQLFKLVTNSFNFNKNLNNLSLNYNNLGVNPDNLLNLYQGIKDNPNLEKLSLSSNLIGTNEESVIYLSQILSSKNCNIKFLSLTRNFLGTQFKNIQILSEALKTNKSLNTLYLTDNVIGTCNENDFTYIAEALKENTSINELNLSHNYITKCKGSYLVMTNLSHSQLGYFPPIAEALKINTSLTKLNICYSMFFKSWENVKGLADLIGQKSKVEFIIEEGALNKGELTIVNDLLKEYNYGFNVKSGPVENLIYLEKINDADKNVSYCSLFQ